jgi:ABC-2 type transport system ATP-binding protein
LAQALIGDPNLLLLDEPSSGLDPEGQEEILSYIEELRLSGKTILMSSHLLPEVTRACTNLVILKEGQILYQNQVSQALSLQPHVVISVDRSLETARALLVRVHPDVSIEGNELILRNEAIQMRRQILAVLINLGFDIMRVDQRRMTLAEIYAEAVQ